MLWYGRNRGCQETGMPTRRLLQLYKQEMIVNWTRIVAVERNRGNKKQYLVLLDVIIRKKETIKKGPTKFLVWESGWVEVTIYKRRGK